MLLGSVRKVRGAQDARKHFPGFPSLHIPQRGEGAGPVALRARSSETLTLSNPEVAGTGVRLRLRGETSAFIKTFFAFVKENNTLRFQKLYERGALSLPSALVLLSLVWKENTALQTNTREKGTGQLKKKRSRSEVQPQAHGAAPDQLGKDPPWPLLAVGSAPWAQTWPQLGTGTLAPGSPGCDTCVPAHAGPKHGAHLADVCGAHTTPSPWPGNCQENTSKSCFLTASHLYFSFVPLS